MFNELSHKKKFYACIALFVILGITAYKRSFKGAIEAVSFYTESKKNIKNNSHIEDELIVLNNEVRALDNIIGKTAKNPEIVQNKILNFLSLQDRDVKLASIDNIHISSDDYFTIYSNKITLKGSYNNLMKTIYAFEKDFEYARIATLKFYVSRNRRTLKKELYNDIIFQNYEKKK